MALRRVLKLAAAVSEGKLVIDAVELALPIVVERQVVGAQLSHLDAHGLALLLDLLELVHLLVLLLRALLELVVLGLQLADLLLKIPDLVLLQLLTFFEHFDLLGDVK